MPEYLFNRIKRGEWRTDRKCKRVMIMKQEPELGERIVAPVADDWDFGWMQYASVISYTPDRENFVDFVWLVTEYEWEKADAES